MNRTELQDGNIVAIHKTPTPRADRAVLATFGDEMTLKPFRRIDDRQVEFHPENHNPEH